MENLELLQQNKALRNMQWEQLPETRLQFLMESLTDLVVSQCLANLKTCPESWIL